jgi:hypothetical protein
MFYIMCIMLFKKKFIGLFITWAILFLTSWKVENWLQFIMCLITTLEKQPQGFTIGYFSSLSKFPTLHISKHTHTHTHTCLAKARNKHLKNLRIVFWSHVVEGWEWTKNVDEIVYIDS